MEQTLTHMDFKSGRCYFSVCVQRHMYENYIPSDIENIQLSSEEKCYYLGKFGQSVVASAQLKMAETVGEGTTETSSTC